MEQVPKHFHMKEMAIQVRWQLKLILKRNWITHLGVTYVNFYFQRLCFFLVLISIWYFSFGNFARQIRQLEGFYKSASNIYFFTGKLWLTEGYTRHIFAFFQSKRKHSWSHVFFWHFKDCFSFLRYSNFRILNFMTSWNAWAWNKKCILLDSLGSKHILVMKFGEFNTTRIFYQTFRQKMWHGGQFKIFIDF